MTTFVSAVTSSAVGAVWPGAQICVTRIESKPARRASVICVLAVTRLVERGASSTAPIRIAGPPACAGAASASATTRPQAAVIDLTGAR